MKALTIPEAKPMSIRYKLVEIGRKKWSGTVTAQGTTGEAVEAEILREARKHLMSRDLKISVDNAKDVTEGVIFAGFHNVGRFEREVEGH